MPAAGQRFSPRRALGGRQGSRVKTMDVDWKTVMAVSVYVVTYPTEYETQLV